MNVPENNGFCGVTYLSKLPFNNNQLIVLLVKITIVSTYMMVMHGCQVYIFFVLENLSVVIANHFTCLLYICVNSF